MSLKVYEVPSRKRPPDVLLAVNKNHLNSLEAFINRLSKRIVVNKTWKFLLVNSKLEHMLKAVTRIDFRSSNVDNSDQSFNTEQIVTQTDADTQPIDTRTKSAKPIY